jgi:hypothetical protein
MTEAQDIKQGEMKKGIATTLQSLLAETLRLETEKLNTVKKMMHYLEEEKENTEYTLEVTNALKTQLELLGLLPATANKSGGQQQKEEGEGYEVEEKEGVI